jgi:hypothetical protein
MTHLFKSLLLIAALAAFSAAAKAQSQQQNKLLTSAELDQLVAPIALYPDALVSEVLMASTYPLEVVEAARWAEQNKALKGEPLKQAADKQSWDESVKSLAAAPDVLDMMSKKLEWTQKLGDAVLAQQADVMDAIQRLRSKADANGKLQTTSQQTVKKTRQANRDVIVIEPAEPNTVYVPYYDPAVVYGPWPYPAYPPYYFAYPGYITGTAIATGIAFGVGFAVGAWAWHDHWWGGGFNWGNNNINFNRQINVNNINNNNWRHNPDHRHGVAYKNADVAKRFSKAGAANRQLDFKGKSGKQVLNPNDRRKGGDARNLSGQTRKAKGNKAGKRESAKSKSRGRKAVNIPHQHRTGNRVRVNRSGGNIRNRGRISRPAGRRMGGGHRLRRHNAPAQVKQQ